MSQLNNLPPRRERKACTECRQQKTRCDVYLHPEKPCSRCRKLNHDCIVSEPFKRENKRQKMSVLEKEAKQLRQQLDTLKNHEPTQIRNSETPSTSNIYYDKDRNHSSQHDNTNSYQLTPASSTHVPIAMLTSSTSARTLDGLKLEAQEIDELFALYFSDFAHHLPILDPSRSPDAYYELSSTLFWAIVGVASRAYTKNPVLLDSLRRRVQDLAIDSLKMAATMECVQALLLVVSWPFPRGGATLSPTFSLSGALIHVAMGVGLHIPAAGQEFTKFRLRLTEEDIRQRAETWAYCVIVYQRTCLFKGNSSVILHDVCQDPAQRSMLFQRLSPATTFNLQLQDVVARLTKALSENGLQEMSSEQEHTLIILIKAFQINVDNLQHDTSSPFDELNRSVAYLLIQSFYLFRTPSSYETLPIVRLYTLACSVISRLEAIGEPSTSRYKLMPFYYGFSLMLASMILLRLYKTPNLAQYIDSEAAKSKIFSSINIAKAASLDITDTTSRIVTVLSQTVGSGRAFKHPNDTNIPVPLRIRSRYALSIILDGTMWWREEFGGTTGIYPTPLAVCNRSQNGTSNTFDLPTTKEPDMGSLGVTNDPNDFLNFDPAWTHFDDMFSPFWAETAGWSAFTEQSIV